MSLVADVYGIAHAVEWIHVGLEAIGATTITVGAASATLHVVRTFRRKGRPFTAARLELSRYLVLALEFQLAADILETAVAPDWTSIGHLAAIGTIRTALNYFLRREMTDERCELDAIKAIVPAE